MKNNLKNRPRPPKPLCPIGTVYEQFLEAFEADLRQMLEKLDFPPERSNWVNIGKETLIKEILGIEGEAKK